MRLALLALLAMPLCAQAVERCSWDRPGADRFTGDLVAAVDDYDQIPVASRARLKRRLASHQYDERVTVTRDHLEGYSDLRSMHFGSKGKVCDQVTRSKWADTAAVDALVYCDGEHCLLVPSACSNLSLVTRIPTATLPPVAELGPEPGAMPEWPLVRLPPLLVLTPPVESFGPLPSEPAAPFGGYVAYVSIPTPVAPVPEPAVWLMMLVGLGLFKFWRTEK